MAPPPKTDPDSVRAGERAPEGAGDAERDPGGVRVDRKRDAAEGLDLRCCSRSRKGSEASDCERGRESESRCLGSLMAEAAMGSDCSDSVRGASSRGCIKKVV